jgi:tripartite-type tricarboxylate transporter receptor subunit TctC
MAYAQANPGKVKYATGGAGTSQHLVMEMLADAAHVKWTHVPFDGSMESITQLLGGHVDCVSETSLWKPHVTAGRLRLLATCGKTRMEAFPEVPTLVESGYNIITPAYVGYAVPKGVPKERLKILHDAFHKAMNDRRYVETIKKFDQELFYLNSEDAKKRLTELYESSGKVIKGLKK